MLEEISAILRRWEKYEIELFHSEEEEPETPTPKAYSPTGEKEPHHLKTELEKVISWTANRKATEVEDIPIELLKLWEEEQTSIMHSLALENM